MKIIDLKDGFEFIMANNVVTVSGFYEVKGSGSYWGEINYALAVFTSDGFRFDFVFDIKEHAKDCFLKLKRFLRSTNSMEDLFSVKEQPGYIKWEKNLLRY
jgi:hypothetical protein